MVCSSGESSGNFPEGRSPSERTLICKVPLAERLAEISAAIPDCIASRSAVSMRERSASLSERKSTFTDASAGIEFTEFPPSMTPKLNVLRGKSGRRMAEKLTMPRASAVIGFGRPKSDQL